MTVVLDSFSINHTTPYAAIALQELNLAYHYPIIFWNTACLTINAGADTTSENTRGTDYGKVAIAVSNMQKEGVKIELPYINQTNFDFTPDVENNSIIYGLKSISGIGDAVAEAIIKYQPYSSIEDFMSKLYDTGLIKNSHMFQLIKAGCFTKIHNQDRKETMRWFMRNYIFEPCKNLTLSQMGKMQEMNFIPKQLKEVSRIINFKKYVLAEDKLFYKHIDENKKVPKRGYHDGHYLLDDISMPFFKQHFSEDSVVGVNGEYYIISEKKFSKEADTLLIPFREWLSNKDTLAAYNENLFKIEEVKHAAGTIADWEMDSLCYYYTNHALDKIDAKKYNFTDFYSLPKEPNAYDWYSRKRSDGTVARMPKFEISRIAGTVLNTDKNHHIVSILTTTGVVNVKFNRGEFAFYNRRISKENEADGKKTVMENSWFARGNKIICIGYRQDDVFRAYRYADTIYPHTCSLIKDIDINNELEIQYERIKA